MECNNAFGERLGALVASWLRVGFCQGNFNADNCLVGARTMDYGPFGWMDEYDPLFAKWTGSGEIFFFVCVSIHEAAWLRACVSCGLE